MGLTRWPPPSHRQHGEGPRLSRARRQGPGTDAQGGKAGTWPPSGGPARADHTLALACSLPAQPAGLTPAPLCATPGQEEEAQGPRLQAPASACPRDPLDWGKKAQNPRVATAVLPVATTDGPLACFCCARDSLVRFLAPARRLAVSAAAQGPAPQLHADAERLPPVCPPTDAPCPVSTVQPPLRERCCWAGQEEGP